MITQGNNRGMKKKIGDLYLLPTGDGQWNFITKIAAKKCNICGKVVRTDELVAHQKTHGSVTVNYQVIHPPSLSSFMKDNVFHDKQLLPRQVNHKNVKLTAPFTTISSTVNDEAIISRKSSDIALENVKKRSHTPFTAFIPLSPSLKLSNSNLKIFKINAESELNNTVKVPVTFVSSSLGRIVGSGSQGIDKQKTPENTKQIPLHGPLFGDRKDSSERQEIDHKKGKEGPDACVSSLSGNSVDQHTCSVCAEVFLSKECLREHVNKHSYFKCDQCNRSFKKLHALANHKRYHSTVKNFKCNVCNYSCAYKAHLMSHQKKKHFNQYHLQCDTCNNGFHSKQELEEHCNSQHSGKKPYTCDKSSKQFPSTRILVNHKSALHEETVNECGVCNKRFVFKTSLVRHMRKHTTVSSFVCELCGKSFSSSSSLKVHHYTHTGEKR